MTYPISLNLSQKQAPSLKQMQRLIMSPQMQQALNLLQLPVMELSALIESEMEQNPILESASDQEQDDLEMEPMIRETEEAQEDSASPMEKELLFDDHDFEIMKQLDDEFKDYFNESSTYRKQRTVDEDKLAVYLENSIHSELTLFGHLMQQAQEVFSTEEEIKVAESIIGSLDERGFLQTPLEEIALLNGFKYDQVADALVEIQKFEPCGVGARTIQEALLLQLAHQGKENSIAYKIVEGHYQDLIHNRIPLIQRYLKCTAQQVSEAIEKDIVKLDLHPGISYSHEIVQQIVPDVIINQENEMLSVSVTDEYLPSFRLNSRYLKMLEDETLTVETKDFIKQKLISAKWLMRNIHQRNDTIERIANVLIEKQSAFFLNPDGKLVPMTMKMLAEELNVHESTVARAVSNKYLHCSRGIFSLRSFFTNTYINDQGEDVSSQTVRDVLLDIIKNENKNKPLSDEAIAAAIRERGIQCARRTVAKYRSALEIGNAHQRKKFN